jgi:hypothetical protein
MNQSGAAMRPLLCSIVAVFLLMLSLAPSAHAIIVDPSEAPNGCALPAGNPLVGCDVSYICDRTDLYGAVVNGALQKTLVASNDQNLCALPVGGPPGSITVSGTLTGNISVTVAATAGITVPTPIEITASLTTSLQAGVTASFTNAQTVPCLAGKWTFAYAYIGSESRTEQCFSTWTCTASASGLNFIDPLVPPDCRSGIPDQIYPGGSATFVGALPDGVLPGMSVDVQLVTCPEQPPP